MYNKVKLKAFSLVELSIVMIIISVALGVVLAFATQKTDADKLLETKEKIEIIDKALGAYLLDNGSIPCPANGTIATNNAAFGDALRGGLNYQCAANFSSGSMSWGIIPVRTLNLPDELAFDAWGRRFSYAIIQDCNCDAATAGCAARNFNTDFCGVSAGITVQGNASSTIMNNAVVVIVSHGKNGHGAFASNGGAARIVSKVGSSINSDEQENAHLSMAGANLAVNATFLARNQILSDDPAVNFDDIVYFKNKQQLINATKGLNADKDNVCAFKDTAGFSTNQCGNKTTTSCATTMDALIQALDCFN
ncbi:MAG: type II secretion system protein [Alphaproteobacteria bacterium]|nr:type II secretion system protein [Alphaproteobacteria bacterium]OJV15738.1 MAG: hypothetical protein BGO27_07470 [Alphaproteobacteria bacterium 33-17]